MADEYSSIPINWILCNECKKPLFELRTNSVDEEEGDASCLQCGNTVQAGTFLFITRRITEIRKRSAKAGKRVKDVYIKYRKPELVKVKPDYKFRG